MKVIDAQVQPLMDFLVAKAKRRSAIRYGEIYKLFDADTRKHDVWETFEEACRRIAPNNEALYGALLAENKTDLPAIGFYDQYKTLRRTEFTKITEGVQLLHDLTMTHKAAITHIERERVHLHAITQR